MKIIFTILFLCSVAGSQVKTVQQSSKQPRCFVYSRHAMTQCIESKDLATQLLAQERLSESDIDSAEDFYEAHWVGSNLTKHDRRLVIRLLDAYAKRLATQH